MKKLLFILFVCFVYSAKSQVYQLMPQYGYQVLRMSFDSTLQIPTTCGAPTLKSVYNTKRGAIAFDSCNNRFYTYNPKTFTWSFLGSGGTTDTTSLSNRINQRIDSLKRSGDSIFARKNGVFVFQYKDSIGGGGGSQNLQTVTNIGATTTKNIYLPRIYYYDSTNLWYSINSNVQDENFYLHSNFLNYDFFTAFDAGISIGNSTNNTRTNIFNTNVTSQRTNQLPDSSGTFALSEYTINSVSQPNDSTLTFQKGATQTSYTIRASVAGSATRLVTSVYNNSGATITKGSVVYINGAHSSNLPTIALAKANAEETSAYTYGLVETDIANNSSGIVIQSGTITNLNLPTSTYTDGQTLYLSPTTAGGYTLTKPLAPYHYVAIGTITRAHPNFGTIQIAIRNGFQLDEMSDVQIPLVPNDSTLLQFSRVDSLWHSVSVNNAIGTKYIKPSDTATMLSKYQRVITSMKYSDTATMLTPYQRSITAVKYSDTASMLTNYAKTSAVNLKVNISDTATMLSPYVRNTPTIAYLSSDFNTSNTTATNTNLTIAVEANTAYRIMINGSASKATSSTGMKISIGAPTGTTIKANASLGQNAISTIVNSFITSVNSLGSTFANGVAVEVPFRVEGIIVTGSTAGSITLQAATVTSNAATIYANTLMTLTKSYAQ